MTGSSLRNSRRQYNVISVPGLEHLEHRLCLTGNVKVSLAGTTLKILGDGLSNDVRITGTAPGEFQVEAIGGTNLNGLLNGSENFTGVQSISMNLKKGDDKVTFLNAELPGRLSYKGAAGSDKLTFGNSLNGSQSIGSLKAILGSGIDVVQVLGDNEFNVTGDFFAKSGKGDGTIDLDPNVKLHIGNFKYLGGDGYDFVDLGDALVEVDSVFIDNKSGSSLVVLDGNVTINGNLTVKALDGTDFFGAGDTGLDNFHVAGSLLLDLGDGKNSVSFAQTESFIGGSLTVVGGAGEDEFELEGDSFYVSENLKFVLGGESDEIHLDGIVVAGLLSIDTGTGGDLVEIERINNNLIGSSFQSAVTINLGDDNDVIKIGLDGDDFLNTLGTLTINGGSGVNTFLNNPSNSFFSPPILSGF